MSKQNYIFYNGEKFLLADYTTMAMKAAEMGKSEGYIRKIIHRDRKGIKQPNLPITIEHIDIPELKLTLVKK